MCFIISHFFNYHKIKIYVTISALIILFITLYDIELQGDFCYNYYNYTVIITYFYKYYLFSQEYNKTMTYQERILI